MKHLIIFLSAVYLSAVMPAAADTTFFSTAMEYSIYLPGNWVINNSSDTAHYFYDTTATYDAFLFISRTPIKSAEYNTPEEWTRAHYLAYELLVQNSYDPWGVVLYSDSSANKSIGNLWAPLTYSHFVSTDSSLGNWREYVRFTATDHYGYEISVLSDTADMQANLGVYALMLDSMKIHASSASQIKPYEARKYQARTVNPVYREIVVDPLGRVVTLDALQKAAGGVYLNNSGKRVLKLRPKL